LYVLYSMCSIQAITFLPLYDILMLMLNSHQSHFETGCCYCFSFPPMSVCWRQHFAPFFLAPMFLAPVLHINWCPFINKQFFSWLGRSSMGYCFWSSDRSFRLLVKERSRGFAVKGVALVEFKREGMQKCSLTQSNLCKNQYWTIYWWDQIRRIWSRIMGPLRKGYHKLAGKYYCRSENGGSLFR